MRLYTFLLLFCSFLVLTSCTSDDDSLDCLSSLENHEELKPYNGENLGCSMYVSKYRFLGEDYFALENHCIDMEFRLFNCDGTPVCEIGPLSCKLVYDGAEYVEIVAYWEK